MRLADVMGLLVGLAVDALLSRLPEGEALRRQYDEQLKAIHVRHSLEYPATASATQPITP